MALTRLDNLISSKTGKYLYVSPDDFNASDELNNRGNSPIRPFKSIQRAFIEIARYSYLPGRDNDRFDQFTIMLMPGKHYIDNRPGLIDSSGIDAFQFDQALSEWTDSSSLDISDPNNVLYKFNNTEGGAIIPRGSSLVGYDLRRTSVHPLYVPDPADMLEKRSAIFNVTGGCYFWQFTIRDGDLEPSSPLYDSTAGVGKVYNQTPPAGSPGTAWTQLEVPNFSHHKLTVFEYADKEELGKYYQKIAKAFSQYQPTIDDANEFGDRIEETRIVGPLSDIRAIESIKCTDSSPAQTITVEVTTKVNHGYFKNQFIAIESNGLDDSINGTFGISSLDAVDKRKFSYKIPGTVSALGTTTNLVSGTTYTTANGLNSNAVVKAEVDSVESASPYVFNCSIRSTWGICGIWANGLKATGFKSMVIAQYTGVSLQKDDRAFIRYDEYTNTFNQASLTDAFATVPYHTKGDAFWKDDWRNFHVRASEDAFIQCVSIFAVGYADHFLMESGGDMSITNSNSNFGNTSLHAKGHKGYAFGQDKGGYITDIVPPQVVSTSSGNIKKNSYYTLDVQASNDVNNHTKLYIGDDLAYDPKKRPAATIEGYRLGAKLDDQIKVKLIPNDTGYNEYHSTLSPTGFDKFTVSAEILNPSGYTPNNANLDTANRIEANRDFIAHEAYGYILGKYPNLKINENIEIVKCRRDIGYLLGATVQDLRLGGNINTIQAAESYYVQTQGTSQLSYITGELTETLEAYDYARDLAIAASRNFVYLRQGCETVATSSLVNVGDTSGIVQGMTVADYDPTQFNDSQGNYSGQLKANATRPNSPVIPDNTFVKRVVDSATIELGVKNLTGEKKVFSNRHGDAANLIEANRDFIAAEAFARMSTFDFPGYTSPSGYAPQDCLDDISDALKAIEQNVAFGGNAETWDAAYHYDSGAVAYLSDKKDETIRCFEYAKDMAIQVMRKEDVFVFGSHGLTQVKTTAQLNSSNTAIATASDPITDVAPDPVNDKAGDARNLILANADLIAHESVERMLLQSSTEKFTPTAAAYNPATGDLTLTINSHGLTGATSLSASDADYTASTGVLTVTSNGHGMVEGERVHITDGSLTFTCGMDSNTTTHAYPRATDPVSGKWLEISNVTTNTFDVNVGDSPLVSFTPSAATYDPATGVMVLTIGNHGLTAGTNIKIAQNSLTFTCAKDSNATQHSYPRSTDPIINGVAIDSVTANTITVNVGQANDATAGAHTFVSSTSNSVVTGGDYVHQFSTATASGIRRENDAIRIDYNALTFTCGMDGNGSQHTYPRVSDPAGGALLAVGDTTANTITVNVGKSVEKAYDVSNASYNHTTGDLVLTVDNHSLTKGQSIRLADGSLTFTCGQDANATQHSYPRSTDPAYQTSLPITAVGSSYHTASDASYDPSTGIIELTVENHGFANGDQIKISEDSLTFTCSFDNNATEHAYPRTSDPQNDKWLTISGATANTFKVNVGAAGPDQQYTPSNSSYDPATGDLVLTIGSHSLSKGDGITIDDNSLSFTCTMDGNQVAQTYPRPGKDQASGRSLPITSVTASTVTVNVGVAGDDKSFTPTASTYNAGTGDLTLTLGQHGLAVGSDITIKDNSLFFTCDKDSNSTQHSYPRPGTDPFAGKSIAVTDVGSTSHTATNAVYTPSTGSLLLSIPNHGFSNGDYIKIGDSSLILSCGLGGAGTHTYVGGTVSNALNGNKDVTGATYDPETGLMVITSAGHGIAAPTTATATGADYDASTGVMRLTVVGHGFNSGDKIKIADNSISMKCAMDGNTSTKTYPRASDPVSGQWLSVTKIDDDNFDVTVGASPLVQHTPTGGSYNPSTGMMTLDIGAHSLKVGTSVKIANESISFTCDQDNYATTHAYPRATDPAYNTAVNITSVTATTITLDVGVAGGTGQHVHNFATATANSITSGGNYVHTFLTASADGILKSNSTATITANSLDFTCDKDGHASVHSYPRTTDPVYNTSVIVEEATADTITIFVGKASVGKAYPRAGYDYPSGRWLKISNAAQNAFEVNVGISQDKSSHYFVSAAAGGIEHQDGTITVNVGFDADSSNQYPHTFVSAVNDAIEYKPQSLHTFVSAGANAVKHLPQSVHTFKRATNGGIIKQGGTITVNVDVGAGGQQYPHTFVSATSGAVISGGQYAHTFVSAVADSVHKIFYVGGTNPASKIYHSQDCVDDVVDVLKAVADNVAYGGNDKVWDAAYSYKTGNHVVGEESETNVVFDYAKEMAALVSRNQKILTIGSHGLTQNMNSQITEDFAQTADNKGGDAYNLIQSNKGFIAEEAYARMILDNPNFLPPTGNPQDCKDDITDFVNEISYNVGFGGNDRVWDMANLFVTGAHVAGEEEQTLAAFKDATEIMIQVMRNEKVLVIGSHGQSQSYDNSITTFVANPINNKVADARDLILANKNFVAEIAKGRMAAQYPSHVYPAPYTDADCLDDLKDIVDVVAHNLAYGGNDRVWDAANMYVAGNASGADVETIYAFNQLKDIIHQVMTNDAVTVGGHTSLSQAFDNTITNGVANGDCDNAKSTVTTLIQLLTNTITTPSSLAGVARTGATYKCPTVESAINTLSGIVSNAITAPESLASVTRTRSAGKCEDVRNSIDTLFTIIQNTITTPASLNSITRSSSNGSCQNVASTISTLFGIITTTINDATSANPTGYLNSIERKTSPEGISFGASVNPNTTTTNSYLWFTLPTGVYADPTLYSPSTDTSITIDAGYPQCNSQSDAVRQFFANIKTIIQNGLNSVPRAQAASVGALSNRATLWKIAGTDPHGLETGTPVRLVPRPKTGVDVDKRKVRLPNGFETNQKYYIIASGRDTLPENYSGVSQFDGSENSQVYFMLASSVENAAAGIYLHSAEVEAIDPDVEIDVYQFILDDKYDLHQYGCKMDGSVPSGIRTDIPHIFDIPHENTGSPAKDPTAHKVFFREDTDNSKKLPSVSGTYALDPAVTFQSGSKQGKIRDDKFFYVRYENAKVFTVYKDADLAVQGQIKIDFAPDSGSTYGFFVFADKRQSPMRFDPSFDNPNSTEMGKWYLNVKPNSDGANTNTSMEILARLHTQAYNQNSGQDKTNDTWFERVKDERDADERIYRFRYVIPKYLQTVRDPLNGFTIKVRKDETRKLLPQKIVLKPITGTAVAQFSNPNQTNEKIGYTQAQFDDPSNNVNIENQYDPYRKVLDSDPLGSTFVKKITSINYVGMTIQSGQYMTEVGTGDQVLELTVFDTYVDNVALANEKLTTVKITAPEGGSTVTGFTVSKDLKQDDDTQPTFNKVTWNAPHAKGYAYIHAICEVPGTPSEWHLILKGVVNTTGTLLFSESDNIRFEQGTVYADLKSDPDYGKSLNTKDLIGKNLPQYFYKQLGASVYTVTPGDIIPDDTGNQYRVMSVEDAGDIDDTFYVFNVQEIKKRIFEQQEGVYYITAVRGNHSPYPTGAGNLGNFRNFKFSQPISKLYPLNYKNDPLWYQHPKLEPAAIDPPATYSAADNYVHGLVKVNDFKGSLTKEAVVDFTNTAALINYSYTGTNALQAQTGNASSGSEDRLIPITGDNQVVSQQKLYVELRRPSIARAGNHTFEYLGFGPGNYSTGMPARQEVVLTPTQDFYAQSKKEDGGLVFYTGLNSNGDLYIGNRKIDAITGEEEFLERAALIDSEDEAEDIGSLVTTFDTPVTFNKNITVNGGDDQNMVNRFNSPVEVNVLGTLGKDALIIQSNISTNASDNEDQTLDRTAQFLNGDTKGDVVISKNRIAASVFQFNPRGSNGAAQGYRIQNHVVGLLGSNITPNQTALVVNGGSALYPEQNVVYSFAGAPLTGDMLLKGEEVGKSGSLGWIYANYYADIPNASIYSLEPESSTVPGRKIKISWNGLTNQSVGLTSGSQIRINGMLDSAFNDTFNIIPASFDKNNTWVEFNLDIGNERSDISGDVVRLWSTEVSLNNPSLLMEYSNSSWKEFGVVGAEAIRSNVDYIGEYKLGINTVARAEHQSAKNAWTELATEPRANLDVVGTAFISGKTFETNNWLTNSVLGNRTESTVDNAFLVGGDSRPGIDATTNNPYQDNESTLRVSTTNGGRVGINVTNAELNGTADTRFNAALAVDGSGYISQNLRVENDLAVNGGSGGNIANLTTLITTGTFEFVNDTTFKGVAATSTVSGSNGLKMAGYLHNIEIGNATTDIQDIKIGNTSASSTITLGATPDGTIPSGFTNSTDISLVTIGGAYNSLESSSETRIGTKSFKIDGDVWLGWRRTPTDTSQTVDFKSKATVVNFLSNSGGPSTLNFATKASEVNIAGQGGTTTINNSLEVKASAKFNSNVELCGGNSSGYYIGDRGQLGTTIVSHNNGLTVDPLNPDKNVDLVNVLVTGVNDPGYNQINTAGFNYWGSNFFRLAKNQVGGNPLVAPQDLPEIPASENAYYMPLLNAPGGYYSVGDYILINSPITSNGHPEIVEVVELTRPTVAPYYLKVRRQPLGTFSAQIDNHPDFTVLYKCDIQFNSTWTTQDLDNTGPQDDVYLAEFGGSLDTADYIIVGRDAQGSLGEFIKIAEIKDEVAQVFTINDCDDPNPTTVFEVNSVTGDTYIGGKLTIDNSVSLSGGCGATVRTFDNNATSFIGDIIAETGSVNATGISGMDTDDIAKLEVGDIIKLTSYNKDQVPILPVNTRITEIDDTSITLSNGIGALAAINDASFSASRNEEVTITNGANQNSFYLDTCNATLEIGSQYRRIQVTRCLPDVQDAADTQAAFRPVKEHIRAYSYWLDPKVLQSNGPISALSANATTGTVPGSVYLPVSQLGEADGLFLVGDLIIVGDAQDIANRGLNAGEQTFEIMKIEAVDEVNKVLRCAPGQEGTTALALSNYTAGSGNTTVMRLLKHPESSPVYDIQARSRTISGVTTPYVSLILEKGYIVQTKLDYANWVRFHDTRSTGTFDDQFFYVGDNINSTVNKGCLFGTVHQDVMNEYTHAGVVPHQTGDLTVNKDLTMIGGDITVYDSVKKTKLFAFRNDDGHADHAANIDFEAGVIGRGTITLYSTSCPENVAVNSCDPSFSVDVFKNVVAGSTFTVNGEAIQSPTRTPKLTVDNLGVSGANKFVINQDQSIDAFGIDNFYTKSGGRHARYIATGADESDKYLTANIQYFANVAVGDTFVVYLPDNPNSGDEVSIIDVGGNLTYNTSIVVRAQGTGTRVQGDATGTSLGIEGTTTWGSGELVVQTPNAGFTLVYLGGTDSDNNVVGGSVTGWWLKEV